MLKENRKSAAKKCEFENQTPEDKMISKWNVYVSYLCIKKYLYLCSKPINVHW